jgi:hypothetical protein
MGAAGEFTVYKKEPARPTLPKSSSKPHVLQAFRVPKRVSEFTVMPAVMSTTINRGFLTGIPCLIVAL